MTLAKNPGANAGKLICRYEYDEWLDEGSVLYLKVEGLQWERATPETFYLAARRRVQRWLAGQGLDPSWVFSRLEVWDVAHDWADGLVRWVTYRTIEPVPLEADDAIVA